jgi:uncharacterized protein GlcG (DUF336 family)
MVHIANQPEMNNGPVEATVLRRQSHSIIANIPMAMAKAYGILAVKHGSTFNIEYVMAIATSMNCSCIVAGIANSKTNPFQDNRY